MRWRSWLACASEGPVLVWGRPLDTGPAPQLQLAHPSCVVFPIRSLPCPCLCPACTAAFFAALLNLHTVSATICLPTEAHTQPAVSAAHTQVAAVAVVAYMPALACTLLPTCSLAIFVACIVLRPVTHGLARNQHQAEVSVCVGRSSTTHQQESSSVSETGASRAGRLCPPASVKRTPAF